ncbi:MAG: cytochrome c biogenesis protein ResB [Planctomycetes bacterium]|nr:cytochrome c biogenesis protein ResB [Planctomycetota bacterium]
MNSNPSASSPPAARPWVWGFLTSSLVITLLAVVGQVVGTAGEPYYKALEAGWVHKGWSGLLAAPGRYLEDPGLHAKDYGFMFAGLVWCALVWLQRAAIRRFFLAMQTGVALVVLCTIGVSIGVLVPQIGNFEDSDQRVTQVNRAEELDSFLNAQGVFLYHLQHLYGIGAPKRELPPEIVAGLDRFGQLYGREERDNREKAMRESFAMEAKGVEISEFIADHEGWLTSAFDLSTALSFNRAYKSYWFATLCLLLALGVGLNLTRYSPKHWFTIHKAGFAIVHIGVLVMLGGGMLTKMIGDRGILHMDLREGPKDTYERHFNRTKEARMPFSLRLDQFGRKDWLALEVHFSEARFKSRPPRYTVWPDRTVDLDFTAADGQSEPRPQLRLRVNALHDHVDIRLPKVIEQSKDAEYGLPLVDLEIPDFGDEHLLSSSVTQAPEGGRRRLYLSPFLPSQAVFHPLNLWRLRVAREQDAISMFPTEEGMLGVLEVEIATAQGAEPEVVPIQVGSTFKTLGGYSIRVDEATRNATFERDEQDRPYPRADTGPLDEQPDRLRAVWIEIQAPDGRSERRAVIEGLNAVALGLQDSYPVSAVVTRLRWNGWSAPGGPRYVLAFGEPAEGGAVRARLIDELGRSFPLELGKALPMPGEEPLVLRGLFARGALSPDLRVLPDEPRADGWDDDFYSTAPRGIELEVIRDPDTPQERRESVRMATTEENGSNVWASPDGHFALLFVENSEMMPFEWRSVLSVLERDGEGRPYVVDLGPERKREIRVNDYFEYRGYRFFQTNADARFPTYSGIGVVYDPGIPWVLGGMYTIIAGMVIAYILRPIVLSRRSQEPT